MMATMVACNHIDEDERLIYVKPVSASRNVLIEDFTGQRCVNCPNATDEIANLIGQYGEATVIAVGIHSGPFSKSVRGVPYALWTEDGDAYFDYWKVESQPKGVIDRRGTSDYTSWGTIVRDEDTCKCGSSRMASRLSSICLMAAPTASMCTTMCSARRSMALGAPTSV